MQGTVDGHGEFCPGEVAPWVLYSREYTRQGIPEVIIPHLDTSYGLQEKLE